MLVAFAKDNKDNLFLYDTETKKAKAYSINRIKDNSITELSSRKILNIEHWRLLSTTRSNRNWTDIGMFKHGTEIYVAFGEVRASDSMRLLEVYTVSNYGKVKSITNSMANQLVQECRLSNVEIKDGNISVCSIAGTKPHVSAKKPLDEKYDLEDYHKKFKSYKEIGILSSQRISDEVWSPVFGVNASLEYNNVHSQFDTFMTYHKIAYSILAKTKVIEAIRIPLAFRINDNREIEYTKDGMKYIFNVRFSVNEFIRSLLIINEDGRIKGIIRRKMTKTRRCSVDDIKQLLVYTEKHNSSFDGMGTTLDRERRVGEFTELVERLLSTGNELVIDGGMISTADKSIKVPLRRDILIGSSDLNLISNKIGTATEL